MAETASSALPGKVILVTGAARGIGSAIAEYLAKSGAKVVDSWRQFEVVLKFEKIYKSILLKKTLKFQILDEGLRGPTRPNFFLPKSWHCQLMNPSPSFVVALECRFWTVSHSLVQFLLSRASGNSLNSEWLSSGASNVFKFIAFGVQSSSGSAEMRVCMSMLGFHTSFWCLQQDRIIAQRIWKGVLVLSLWMWSPQIFVVGRLD